MKKSLLLRLIAFVSLLFAFSAYAEQDSNWNQLAEEYPLKPHHKALKFDCVMCHEGNNPDEFEPLETENCLSCHGSTQKLADRLGFMDKHHTNPHNSFHDGLDLDCYECHAEHEPSTNLCSDCHTTTSWMDKVP
ncbi:MAG: cytochrome c3 family protein [Vibrionaceae bacterium]|nr:cytochrome c3 family protein [Vibrionaceae bacterium]